MWEFQMETSLCVFCDYRTAALTDTVCTEEEGGSLFYHRDILKKQLREDHSSTGRAQTLRYISPAFTYPDKMPSSTALSFLLISFDWALMGFADNIPLFFTVVFLIKIQCDMLDFSPGL